MEKDIINIIKEILFQEMKLLLHLSTARSFIPKITMILMLGYLQTVHFMV